MKTSRNLAGLVIGVLTSVGVLLSGAANASVHSLSFAGGVFNYSAGTLSSTASNVVLSYDGSPISTGTPYTLDFSGLLTGGGSSNGILTNVTFDIKNSGGTVVFAGTDAHPSQFFTSGHSAAILGDFTTTTAISPVAGLVPGGSFGISLSGWNGVVSSGSGSSGTFTTSVPEAGSSAAMALLLVGGGLVGVRRRRK